MGMKSRLLIGSPASEFVPMGSEHALVAGRLEPPVGVSAHAGNDRRRRTSVAAPHILAAGGMGSGRTRPARTKSASPDLRSQARRQIGSKQTPPIWSCLPSPGFADGAGVHVWTLRSTPEPMERAVSDRSWRCLNGSGPFACCANEFEEEHEIVAPVICLADFGVA